MPAGSYGWNGIDGTQFWVDPRNRVVASSGPGSAPLGSGLSRDWGSCRDGCWWVRVVGGLEALPEADAERAVVDGAADLEQPVGTTP